MVGLPDELAYSSKDHEIFSIHEDLLDNIIATHYNKDTKLKIICKDLDQLIDKDILENQSKKSKKNNDTTDITHYLNRKRQKKIDY